MKHVATAALSLTLGATTAVAERNEPVQPIAPVKEIKEPLNKS